MAFSFNLKEQIIIGITVIVLIMVVFAIFIFKPQYDRYSDAKTRIEKEIEEQNKKEQELNNLKNAKKEAARTEAKSLALSKKMPEEADLPSVLVEIDNAGRESNVKVLDITPGQVAPNSGYSTLPTEVKIVGSFFNISDFLYRVVKLPREYTVSNVSIEVAEQGYPMLSSAISLTTYLYTPDSTAAQTTDASPQGEQ